MTYEEQIVATMDQIKQGLSEYAPSAFAAVIRSVQYAGIARAAIGIVFLILSLVCLVLALRYANEARSVFAKEGEKENKKDWTQTEECSMSIFCGVVSGIAGVITLILLLNPWTWVRIFDPNAFLAKQFISRFLGH